MLSGVTMIHSVVAAIPNHLQRQVGVQNMEKLQLGSVGSAHFQRERNGFLLRVHAVVCARVLDTADIVRDSDVSPTIGLSVGAVYNPSLWRSA